MLEQLGTMYPHPEEGKHQWCEKQNKGEIGLWIMWGTTEMQTCVTPHLCQRNVAITGAAAPVNKLHKNDFVGANNKHPQIHSKGFWQWCITIWVTEFLDFVHHLVF